MKTPPAKLIDRYADPVAEGHLDVVEFEAEKKKIDDRFLSVTEQAKKMCIATGAADYVLAEDIEAHLKKFLNVKNGSLEAAIEFLRSMKPRDPIEGMLISQMYATHAMAMDFNARAAKTERVDFSETYLNQANRLMRTFVTQIEALNRHRGKGQQNVTVKHVHVDNGGQAVIGYVARSGGGRGYDET